MVLSPSYNTTLYCLWCVLFRGNDYCMLLCFIILIAGQNAGLVVGIAGILTYNALLVVHLECIPYTVINMTFEAT